MLFTHNKRKDIMSSCLHLRLTVGWFVYLSSFFSSLKYVFNVLMYNLKKLSFYFWTVIFFGQSFEHRIWNYWTNRCTSIIYTINIIKELSLTANTERMKNKVCIGVCVAASCQQILFTRIEGLFERMMKQEDQRKDIVLQKDN